MTSFSSLLSSINDKPQAPQSANRANTANQNNPSSYTPSSRFQLTANNAAAGVKRKAESSGPSCNIKPVAKPSTSQQASRSAGVNETTARTPAGVSRPGTSSHDARKSISTSGGKDALARSLASASLTKSSATSTTPASASTAANKKGFASILEKAKAAQAASQAAPGGIKHKPVEKLTRRERLRRAEEYKEQERLKTLSRRTGKKLAPDITREVPQKRVAADLGYKGTMKPAEPAYKGTMKREGERPSATKSKQKGQAQDKYGGYASWSDLDDAEEDEDERGYDSYDSDDMEGGFDDLEHEEELALKAARKEDQEALEEETRLKNEKLERKRKLEQMNKAAAARRRH